MIIKYKNFLITESPDLLYTKTGKHEVTDNDAIAFFSEVNNNHTEATIVYVGNSGESHAKVGYAEGRVYPGRLWLNDKLISFWVYPNPQLFKTIMITLEKKLNIQIYNNDWRVEVIKKDGKIYTKEYNPNDKQNDYFFPDDFWLNKHIEKTVLIPVEKYIGSENFSDELLNIHTADVKKREELKKKYGHPKGWGSDKTSWDSNNPINLRYKNHQENNKN